jgi:adenylyltransferase/sulfurtransferase
MGDLLAAVGEADGASGEGGAEGASRGELAGAVLYCAAGSRSASAQRVLAERGIAVRSLRGGFAGVPASEVSAVPEAEAEVRPEG